MCQKNREETVTKMSFLNELKNQKNKLKVTETVVTKADGNRFVESKTGCDVKLEANKYGFVVDTKPDDVPALVIEHLFIGSQDCTAPHVLNKYDIKHVLSVGIEVDLQGVHCKYVPCLDLPETDVTPVLEAALPFINDALDRQENILIHCNAGVSRTSMVAIAYLILCKNMTYEDAYSLVKTTRPAIQPNAGFKKQLNALSSIK